MDEQWIERGKEKCDMCQGRDEKERRQAVRERVIRRLNEEIDDSIGVVNQADDSVVVIDQADDNRSKVSIDQGRPWQNTATLQRALGTPKGPVGLIRQRDHSSTKVFVRANDDGEIW
jgi:hypothetical protein